MNNFASFDKMALFLQICNKNISHKMVKRVQPHFVNDTWDLGDRKFNDLSAKELFKNASQVYGSVLWIDYNKNPSILKQIAPPFFTSLQTIYLGDNNITLLEDLAFLNIPQIKHISLNDNLISNIKSIAKCNLPKIQYLSLNGNRIFQYQTFKKFTGQNLSKLKLLDQITNSKVWENINVLWLMKTSMSKQKAQICFDPKFITTPQLCLIKLKVRRRNCIHPCSVSNISNNNGINDNSSPCSPLPSSD